MSYTAATWPGIEPSAPPTTRMMTHSVQFSSIFGVIVFTQLPLCKLFPRNLVRCDFKRCKWHLTSLSSWKLYCTSAGNSDA